MKVKDLKEYFDDAKSNSICFVGKCHDCGKKTEVDIDHVDEKIVVSGGAAYKSDDEIFLKCDTCFTNDPTLKRYQECEVYSRVVGYLRPIKNWNPGKKAEYLARKTFKIELK